MPDARLGQGLERLQQRRLFLDDLLLVAIGIGLLVNLFASALFVYITDSYKKSSWGEGWGWTLVFLSLLLFAILLVTYKIRCQKDIESSYFTLVLPILIDPGNNNVEILHHDHYKPAKQARQFSEIIKNSWKTQFLQAWPGCKFIRPQVFGPANYCWGVLAHIVQALLFQELKKYGELTLTQQVRYHTRFLRLAVGGLTRGTLERTQWPQALQENKFITAEKLFLPVGALLTSTEPSVHPNEPPGRRDLTVSIKHGSLTFSISPYWITLREIEPAIKIFDPQEPEKICFLAIPIETRLIFQGSLLKRKAITIYHYLWLKKLRDAACHYFSWGKFLGINRECGNDL